MVGSCASDQRSLSASVRAVHVAAVGIYCGPLHRGDWWMNRIMDYKV